MKHKFWQAFQFGKYLLRCNYFRSFNSVLAYEINQEIFKEKAKFYAFNDIEAIRSKLLLTNKEINVVDLGAGSQVNNSTKRNIKDIASSALKSKKSAQVLFRLVNKFKPKTIVEIGTSLGITTSYLAKANQKARVITLEGSNEIASVAKINFKKLNITTIEQVLGNFNSTLSAVIEKEKLIDFVYFDGNHKKEPTLAYFKLCLSKANENSIFVFDDIYWSKEMTEAWGIIKNSPKVTLTIDCFEMGIIFFKEGETKQNITVYH